MLAKGQPQCVIGTICRPLQIAPSDEEVKKLKAYVELPDKSAADLSTPEQFLHVLGQVKLTPAMCIHNNKWHICADFCMYVRQQGAIETVVSACLRPVCNKAIIVILTITGMPASAVIT